MFFYKLENDFYDNLFDAILQVTKPRQGVFLFVTHPIFSRVAAPEFPFKYFDC